MIRPIGEAGVNASCTDVATGASDEESWLERSPKTCNSCGFVKNRGWSTAYGEYFCNTCWDDWQSIPVAASGSGLRAAGGNVETNPKRSKVMLCKLMGVGCGCCGPSSLVAENGTEDDDDSWRSLFNEPDLPELCGLNFGDAHCHLDIVLQNNKHGELGWDSKQKICKYWLEGECDFVPCDFAHGEQELEKRVNLVREDIEPYLQHYAGRRSAGNIKRDVNSSSSSQGPILHFLVTSCGEICAIEDTKRILEIAEQICPRTVFCSFGCHPHDYRNYSDEMETRFLSELDACGPRAVAWGEVGLDYYKNYDESLRPSDRRRMMEVFARQARIAVIKKLPLVVHSRDAESDTLQVLKECLPRDHKFYVHAYRGDLSMMREALEAFPNCVFGVSGMILLKWPVEGAVDVARHCPLERLVLETDAPYLANGPQDIPKMAQEVAKLKGLSPALVMETTCTNCRHFFGV